MSETNMELLTALIGTIDESSKIRKEKTQIYINILRSALEFLNNEFITDEEKISLVEMLLSFLVDSMVNAPGYHTTSAEKPIET